MLLRFKILLGCYALLSGKYFGTAYCVHLSVQERVDLDCQILRMEAVLGIQVVPVFSSGQSRFMGFRSFVLRFQNVQLETTKFPDFFFFQIRQLCQLYEHIDLPLVVENIYSSKTV
jgi:hypothetical protein